MPIEPIPESRKGFIPYLMIDGAAEAIRFYENAFGAKELYRLEMPDGKIGHAELDVDGNVLYLADAPDDMPGTSANPKKLGGTSVLLHRYVADVDAVFAQAIAAGATAVREPEDQFYGDRAAVIEDPFGHAWSLHTHIRDVSPEEMAEAIAQMTGGDDS